MVSLLSRYKSNNNNWISESPLPSWDSDAENDLQMGVFSKIDTLKNCRIV